MVTNIITNSNGTGGVRELPKNVVLLDSVRRRIQNFLLVWLDANLDENKKDFKKCVQQLRRCVASIHTFTDAQQCIDFLSKIQHEKVFMIVSGALGQRFIPEIQELPQLDAIYVLCDNKEFHSHWVKDISKVKGVYTRIEPICESLQNDRENCDRTTISISFDKIDPLFIYAQLLKEALLEVQDDDEKSIKEFVEFCRLQGDIAEEQIEMIKRQYHEHSPVWWYTGPFFLCSMLNRGFRILDIDIITKMSFFIRHLHNHIKELFDKQQIYDTTALAPFQVYRGQGLSLENFDKMKQSKGNLMSFNNFLSTNRNRKVSLRCAQPDVYHWEPVGVLFVMTIDPKICRNSSIPFIDTNNSSYSDDGNSEILFTPYTIFQIDSIQKLTDDWTGRVWEVSLTLIGIENHECNSFVSSLREDSDRIGTGWSRFGHILISLGEHTKAEHLYQLLLENTSIDSTERANYYNKLGLIYDELGEYSKALESCERSLEIRKKAFPSNEHDIAASYSNIGLVYCHLEEYSKALSSYEKCLEIRKVALPPNHPDLATSYNSMALVYCFLKQYSKSLSSYEQCLEIQKATLPPDHPYLATTYNDIGMVYDDMGEHLKALASYERCLEIQKAIFPPNHPGLATTYNNMATVYYNMSDYTKALASYEQSLDIKKIALPSNHPSLGATYNSIGAVYENLGIYTKALASYERSLEIRKIGLPPNDPSLISSYENMGLLYHRMGDYQKALSCYETVYETFQISFPPDHPYIEQAKRNIDNIKKEMI